MNKLFIKSNNIYVSLMTIFFVILYACTDNFASIRVSDIKLDSNEISIMVGDKQQLKSIITPSDASNKKVQWTSADTLIATVNVKGEVTGVTEGETIITVTSDDGHKKASCKVTVTTKVYPVTAIMLDITELLINLGEQKTINATILPENATNKNVTWKSSADNIATVDDGIITGVAEGEALITVTTEDGAKQAFCRVTVIIPGKVRGITLDVTELSLLQDETRTIEATIIPEDAINKNISWSTSDANIVTVDNAGKVTAIAPGEATVTATTEDGGKTAECRVSVVLTFRDDFNRANTGRKGIDTPNGVGEDWLITHGEFEIKDQALYAYYNKSKPNHSVLLYNAPGAITKTVGGSFKFSCDVKIPPGTWGGILFNAQSSSSYYVLRVKTGSDQLQFLATADNGSSWKVLNVAIVKPKDIFAANTTLRFTVESLEPGKYYASITDQAGSKCYGEFILTDNQSFNYNNGQAGFWTMGSAVVYDNFVLGVK